MTSKESGFVAEQIYRAKEEKYWQKWEWERTTQGS